MSHSESIFANYQKEHKVSVECPVHGYAGIGSKKKPEYGCKTCNEVTFFTILARKSKNSFNKEALDELEAYVRAICELEDEGAFDFKVNAPTFDVQKDAAPD